MKSPKIFIPMCYVLYFASVSVSADTINITGKVTTLSGDPVSGATIKLKAAGLQTTSDTAGNYALVGTTPSGVAARQINHVKAIEATIRRGSVVFEIYRPSEISIDLYDLSGALVRSVVHNRQYVAGSYHIKIENQRLAQKLHIVKVRIADAETMLLYMPGKSSCSVNQSYVSANTIATTAVVAFTDSLTCQKPGFLPASTAINDPLGIYNFTLGCATASGTISLRHKYALAVADIQMIDSSNGWLCVNNAVKGFVYKWNGSTWSSISSGVSIVADTWSLSAIAPINDTQCYVVGTKVVSGSRSPVLLFCNQNSCLESTDPAPPAIAESIYFAAYRNGILWIGNTRNLYKYSGGTWTTDFTAATSATIKFLVSSDSSVWVFYQGQIIMGIYYTAAQKNSGSGWSSVNIQVDGADVYQSVWVTDDNTAWFVGTDGDFADAIFQYTNGITAKIAGGRASPIYPSNAVMQDYNGLVWVAANYNGSYFLKCYSECSKTWTSWTISSWISSNAYKFGRFKWLLTGAEFINWSGP